MKLDIKTFYNQLEATLKEKLDLLGQEEYDVIGRYYKSIVLIADALTELRSVVKGYDFKDTAEEISFFKYQKPALQSQYFYFQQLISLKMNEPPRVTGRLSTYYVSELENLQTLAKAEAEFIHYYLNESTHLDDRYFVRGYIPAGNLTTDREFSTGYDERVSRALANRMLKDHIITLIESSKSSGDEAESSLTWTGSKADLIELIYGLETVGTINNGKADIKEIASRFESLFNINLGNFYRQFMDIRLRKKEKTTFLNQIKERLEGRINNFG